MKIPVFWFFLISLCSITMSNYILGASGYCLGHQQSLLLHLKDSLIFDATMSTKLVQWNQAADCCQWNGVTCNEGWIIGLDLSDEWIAGGIDNSSSLFGLQYLQRLNLSDNLFNISIPSGIQRLTNLRHLDLSNAGFVGQIPIEISQLTNLETLDLSVLGNGELNIQNPNLLKLLQNLTKITELYLDGVNISANGNEWGYAVRSSLPNLRILSLRYCGLLGPIDSSFATLESLSEIYLSGNNLSGSALEFFADFKNLTILYLVGCELTRRFPESIFRVQTLSVLDISRNFDLLGSFPDFPRNGSLQTLIVRFTNFSGPLPDTIGNLRKLSTLDLSYCQFNGTLPNSLSNLTQIVELDLSDNQFTGTLPSSLSNLTQIVELDLSDNQFTGLVPSFSACKKLVRLYLSDNFLTGAIPSSHFQGLMNLVDIGLYHNLFNGRIPSSMFELPSVRFILLFHNHFEGQLDDFFNPFSRLSLLDLRYNRLEGPIPLSLFNLGELIALKLSYNKFSGKVELSMFRRLGNLTTLELSNNNLTIIDANTRDSSLQPFPTISSLRLAFCNLTTFPKFLKNQSRLDYLDLSNNHIVGTIPSWISNHNSLRHLYLSYNYLTDWEDPVVNNMTSLHVLDLHSNNLQGPNLVLPYQIRYLDYSSNNLTSVLPQKIDRFLRSTLFLSFSSNNLHGNIPKSICNAPNLQVLDLSYNSLTGIIPNCLIAIGANLDVLDLGRNKLNGTIDTVPGFCYLRTLILNGNFLQGMLPKYLVHCKMLEVLDLGNNQIDDRFPCWLERIPTLHVLILRSNKLHGSIECPGTKGTWLHLQILDLASNGLNGRIPSAFIKSWKAMIANENDVKLSKLNYLQLEVLFKVYYQDRVTLIIKGQEAKSVKIHTIFTAVDMSCNKFEGPIPEEFGQLKALHILNLSHNALGGHILSSLGNLKNLESLDLSSNSLRGEIPTQLANLNFLSFMNLSYNHLVGRIPTSTQLQSFEAASFVGNERLCGPPLTPNCSSGEQVNSYSHHTETSIDWNFISSELGFAFGIGMIFLPLLFWKQWRLWYWKFVDDILYHIFPQLEFVHERRDGKNYITLRWKPY